MLPVMQAISDGKQHKNKEIQQKVADLVGLTEDDKREKLPSGIQPTYKSRTNWAITYLTNAGLITKMSRGIFEISDTGRTVVSNPPDRLDTQFLMKFPIFVTWAGGSLEKESISEDDESVINN